MPTVQPFPAGGYRFISHQFQYSGGVAAEPGFRIERARFARSLPLADGFDAIEAYLAGIGRSPTAFCACELRSPAQFTDAGFVAFNRHYVERLAAWGIYREEVNPVARSNVCPEIDPPTTPSFYAFSYTVPSENRPARSFVAAGSGEAREGGPSYEGRIIRPGDHSPEAMREKAIFVLAAMEQRMAALGFSWADVTRFILSSTSIRSWPTSSSAGEPCRAVWPGISRARRCRASISRLMYAASPANW
jgi:hypothetical protein